MRRVIGLLTLFLLLLSCQQKENKEAEQPKSLIPQKEYAVLVVESKGCIYCAQLKKDIKTDPKLKEALKDFDVYTLLYESYEPVETNIGGERRRLPEKELAVELEATSFPYVVFYDRSGNVIVKIPGYMPPDKLACVARYVKSGSYRTTTLQDYLKQCT
ncbi:MAG: thioredoxin fold domain-containing protein [Aquificae bacterium]|nr:thioredoxin fold domain-containing protein [Aquificota bacterium]